MLISHLLHKTKISRKQESKKDVNKPHKEISKTGDKTGWDTGRKSEEAKGRHSHVVWGLSGKELKLMHPERGRRGGKKLKARKICNSLRKRGVNYYGTVLFILAVAQIQSSNKKYKWRGMNRHKYL